MSSALPQPFGDESWEYHGRPELSGVVAGRFSACMSGVSDLILNGMPNRPLWMRSDDVNRQGRWVDCLWMGRRSLNPSFRRGKNRGRSTRATASGGGGFAFICPDHTILSAGRGPAGIAKGLLGCHCGRARSGGHVQAVGAFARQKNQPGRRTGRHEEEKERRFAEKRVTISADRREDQGARRLAR